MTKRVIYTVDMLKAEVRRMDPKVNGRALKAGVIMLAALQEGTSFERLVEFTGFPRRTVFEFVKRLRMNGVFTDDGRVAAAWFDKDGGIAFWMDVNVALGFIKRGLPEMVDAGSSGS
jgi:hypothetical protein